ncbi:MAG: hypothetical protein JNM68_10945 [Dinghuibacter sp.]|nr:hypothetical protein [Dinghuibacter sp.]
MTGVFGRKNPSNIILLLFYGLLLRLFLLNAGHPPIVANSDGPLYRYLLEALQPAGRNVPALYTFLAFILLFSQALSINTIVNRLRLMNRPNFLPAMSYLLITAFFSEWNRFSSALIVNTLLLWIWSSLNRLQQGENTRSILFNAGFALAVCNFVYSYSFTFSLVVFAALLLYRSVRLNEYLLPLLGYLTPCYFILAWRYWTDNWHYRDFLLRIHFKMPVLPSAQWTLAGVGIILLLALLGFYFVQQQSSKMLIQARKSWALLLIYLLISLFIPFINADFGYWILCLLPLSAFIACAFMYLRSPLTRNLLHWLAFIFALVAGYFLG